MDHPIMFNPSSTTTTTTTTTTPSPILYVDNILNYLLDDLNPNYSNKQEDHYLTSYYQLPSPLIYNEIEGFVTNHDLQFLQQPSLLGNNLTEDGEHSSIFEVEHQNKVEGDENENENENENEINGIVEDCEVMNQTKDVVSHGGLSTKRKRSSNKDRHSKIRTAQGLRDRRMRLSLEVARPFFKLQDMLGFDKASRTVEWLLLQSKSATEEAVQSKNGSASDVTKCTTMSSTASDDCEVDSTIVVEGRKGGTSTPKVTKKGPKCVKKDEHKMKKKRTKEERKVAIERAKKRTLERMIQNQGGQVKEINHEFVDDADLKWIGALYQV
ncbi:hypothetical protein SOVF_087960 [Spinacia oleracea]|uniref:Transcription factor CYCLOIDEA n=1 Tax=Spinacia oleracea TaxID=3562 RepID=A0A9R0JX65_SPIOL|nr:transcription factor CYCLOIDEA-like [Spinacia oleracea]KNA16555.1 hypothetical protein SOVF_087960 [Spinacia oleracea]